ncbi:uncharacterized protein EV420DRAFT_303721 [Desarmillaria tabescens]|uniref:Secreted protein n=1 Tax=Armillaria tabescens TaxID=1929756 RepID=A0AA39N5Y2_ARMTA|nr:uncharacterized protein EV420DRAFT_756865 [Desarmillaria tabescens]XP_060331333.1 uncharacterized protein EV420DRAFT_303721 [Desarmillaria tabescens]KAK0431787.1 hypothetical protein EV420DRAFT_756865 [Desarmillaria tabescens]KAK0459107.1 hypothetical protein EV420DRAFT_303721 [Desarmillaria tabescens]
MYRSLKMTCWIHLATMTLTSSVNSTVRSLKIMRTVLEMTKRALPLVLMKMATQVVTKEKTLLTRHISDQVGRYSIPRNLVMPLSVNTISTFVNCYGRSMSIPPYDMHTYVYFRLLLSTTLLTRRPLRCYRVIVSFNIHMSYEA